LCLLGERVFRLGERDRRRGLLDLRRGLCLFLGEARFRLILSDLSLRITLLMGLGVRRRRGDRPLRREEDLKASTDEDGKKSISDKWLRNFLRKSRHHCVFF
jgi:hypothetical protein